MWIFSTPKNYSEMIEKISKSSFVISLILLYILSSVKSDFYAYFEKLSLNISYDFNGIKFSLGLIIFPLFIGISEHIFNIHDKISHLLNIRRNFDRNCIVQYLMKKFNITSDNKQITETQVNKIMSIGFYDYVSSTSPKIDPHYIYLSLNNWCWFWIFLDSMALFVMIGVFFMISNYSLFNLGIMILISLMFMGILFLIYKRAKHFAMKEVDAIYRYVEDKEKLREEISCIIKSTDSSSSLS